MLDLICSAWTNAGFYWRSRTFGAGACSTLLIAMGSSCVSCCVINGFIVGSILVFYPVNCLHMTGTIFLRPVAAFVVTTWAAFYCG